MTTKGTPTDRVETLIDELQRNADAYHFEEIDHDKWSARSVAIWRELEALGVSHRTAMAMLEGGAA